MIGPQIFLASRSPRRRTLIDQLGIPFQTVQVDVDETPQSGELPQEFVSRLATDKARAGWQQVAQLAKPAVIVGADTCIVLNGVIIGKPADKAQFFEWLNSYSAATHEVLTGVAVIGPEHGKPDAKLIEAARVSVTQVSFRRITEQEMERYWQSGEPQDKAGGYAIQGRAAAFVENIQGSYSGVMGLPLFEFSELIQKFGIQIFDA